MQRPLFFLVPLLIVSCDILSYELIQSILQFIKLTILDLEDCLPHAMMEMFDMEFDFPPRAHCLSRW